MQKCKRTEFELGCDDYQEACKEQDVRRLHSALLFGHNPHHMELRDRSSEPPLSLKPSRHLAPEWSSRPLLLRRRLGNCDWGWLFPAFPFPGKRERERRGGGTKGGARPSHSSRIGGTADPLNWPLPGPKPAKAELSIACNLGQRSETFRKEHSPSTTFF